MATPSSPDSPGLSPSAGAPFARTAGRSLAPAWEIAIAYLLVEGALWTEGYLRWAWSLAAAAWIVGATVFRRTSPGELGLSRKGLREQLWVVPAALAVGGGLLFVANLAGTLHAYVLRRSFFEAALAYLFWSWQQEFILQSFIFIRLESLLGDGRKAAALAALLFSLAHLPNPVLLIATFIAGWVFCELFRRYRNIYPLAVAHAILGIAVAVAVPEAVHHHMRVGIGYLTYPH